MILRCTEIEGLLVCTLQAWVKVRVTVRLVG